jgi:hypothetical protein
VHARTTADASLYLARCLTLLGPAHAQAERWRGVLRRSLDAAVTLQLPSGQFGQLYDVVAGTVAQTEGDGGLLWIPALAAAEPLFADDPAFQKRLALAMRRAGDGYAPDVLAERLRGAPEDVSLAPTSEDGYNGLLAYAALHRRFGGDDYAALLRQVAEWTLTWRKAYNVRFPRRSLLGGFDFRTVGGDFASARNNHLHCYGMNCLDELAYVGALTGEAYFAHRADDHFAYTSQLLCTVDGQWGGQRGMCDEQFYTSDWSFWGLCNWDPTPAHVQKGTICGFSHVWCINMLLLGLESRARAGRLAKDTRAG